MNVYLVMSDNGELYAEDIVVTADAIFSSKDNAATALIIEGWTPVDDEGVLFHKDGRDAQILEFELDKGL